MRLRTTVAALQADGYETLRHNLEHDAMAAHALLQAMGEFHPSNEAARASFELTKNRAAEILAGWLVEDRG